MKEALKPDPYKEILKARLTFQFISSVYTIFKNAGPTHLYLEKSAFTKLVGEFTETERREKND